MWTLILWGGFPIWFVIAFGLLALAAAARFAYSAERKHLGVVIGLSVATLFSILNGIVADLATVGHSVMVNWDKFIEGTGPSTIARIISQGTAESLTPGILGFTLLSLTWLVAAAGLARAARQPA